MKTNISNLIKILLLTIFIQACGQTNRNTVTKEDNTQVKEEISKGIVNNKIVCVNDSTQSYAAYLPADYSPANKYPVIIFFDAHARGKLPVNKYKTLAEKYGYILIGSNNSKNELDWNTVTNIFQLLINDVLSRLSIDKSRIYTSGFSGGAKVSGILCAMNSDIKGDIGCAAGFPLSKETTERNFDYIGFAGNEDFNMNDMKELDRRLDETSIRHNLVIYDGKHDWCPENIMEEAFKWLDNPQTVKGNPPTPAETAKEIKERDMMEYYANNIDKQNISWWKREVGKLNEEIKNGNDKGTTLRDKRVLNYTSLITFMHATKALNSDYMEKAENYLEIYKLVDPTNSEYAYLFAQLYVKQNKTDKAMNSLKEAVKLGFDDYERLKKDNVLNPLKARTEYKDIVVQLGMNK